MAAATLPEPGSKYGPCVEPCEHRDCKETRDTAAHACHWCDTPIGYGRRFYMVDGKPVHASCEEDSIDR